MNVIHAKVTQGGRLVIPASIRKSMKLADGEVVLLRLKGNVLEVEPLRARLAAVQAACSQVLTGGNVVDEFLDERRHDVAKELH